MNNFYEDDEEWYKFREFLEKIYEIAAKDNPEIAKKREWFDYHLQELEENILDA